MQTIFIYEEHTKKAVHTMENLETKPNDLRTLDQIVGFCRTIQTRYGESSQLQMEKRKYQRALIDICRRCGDEVCPEECEVKKAYRVTL